MTHTAEAIQIPEQTAEDAWMVEKNMEDFPNFMVSNSWNFPSSSS